MNAQCAAALLPARMQPALGCTRQGAACSNRVACLGPRGQARDLEQRARVSSAVFFYALNPGGRLDKVVSCGS